jgi:two-component system KDP operon response regulator KdpE
MQKLLEIILESNAYSYRKAATGKEGIIMAANHPPDLILLDIGLPDKSGHDVLSELRMWYNKSIIILSVQDSEADIVKALDNGATDYLTKPFRTAELLARIRSALRKNSTAETTLPIEKGELFIDLGKRIVRRAGQPVKLTATEYKLLALLVKNEGTVMTHHYILKEVWGSGNQNDTQYLRVFIGALRKKIEADPNQPRYIITESGIGYRFI